MFFCICLGADAFAQDPFRSRFEEFSKSVRSQYDGFRKECNERFAEFLKSSWTEFKAAPVLCLPEEEWDAPVPYDAEKDTIAHDRQLRVEEKPVELPDSGPQPEPVEPLKPSPPSPNSALYQFDYFGTKLSVSAFDSMRFEMKGACDGRTLNYIWTQLFSGEYDRLLADLLKIRKERTLCDWAYMKMLDRFTTSFLGGGNESTLLFFYLLSQSGYKVRLGRTVEEDEEMLCLLYCSDASLIGVNGFVIDDECFYLYHDFGVDTMEILPIGCFEQEKSVSFNITQVPVLTTDYYTRTLNGTHLNVSDIRINRNLTDFYSTFPEAIINDDVMTRWALKAGLKIDPAIEKTLYSSLSDAISGRTEYEAVGVILNFLQTALTYRKDDLIWGRDRAFFNEETLFYPYCDCEDRAILFSRLIKDVVGLDVVLVYYPGHLAAAVEFSTDVKGDCVMYEGCKFIVCDPTYVPAPIGLTMKGCDNAEAKLILVR